MRRFGTAQIRPRSGQGLRFGLAAFALTVIVSATGTLGSMLVAMGPTAAAAATPASPTVWLCRPGQAGDPCLSSLSATSVSATGARTAQAIQPASDPAVDCFYVYPTVSSQKTANANLRIEPAEIAAAVSQASPFSQVCRVWAPMYRQRTTASLAAGLGADPAADEIAYQSLLAGFRDYMAHDNDGRPIVFIGHSQGAAMLIRLIRGVIDPSPKLRSQLVSAIILGGNVQVPNGRLVGGSFRHVPACTRQGQTGCVIAYSSFPSEPPLNTNFGRPGAGVSLQSDQHAKTGQTVLCTNPADLGSGAAAPLLPSFLAAASPTPGAPITTPWVSYPGLYSAACTTSGGATWLQVSVVSPASDTRPKVTEALGPTWGYHLDDVNLALGNLVQDVRAQTAAFARHKA
jgi:hypothetical protein